MLKFNTIFVWVVYLSLSTCCCIKGQQICNEQQNQAQQNSLKQCNNFAELRLTQSIKDNVFKIPNAICKSISDKVDCSNTYFTKCFNSAVAQENANQLLGDQLKNILSNSNFLNVSRLLQCPAFKNYFRDSRCPNYDFFQSQSKRESTCLAQKIKDIFARIAPALVLSGTLQEQYAVNLVCELYRSMSVECANPCHSLRFFEDNIKNTYMKLVALARTWDPTFTLDSCLSVLSPSG